MPEEKPKGKLSLKDFSNVAKLFWLHFFAPKTKSTSQARIKPEILSTLGPNPTPKSRVRFTTLVWSLHRVW